MDRKPRDILEFLRRQGAEPPDAPAAPVRPPEAEATQRVLFVRRSQVVVAACGAGLAVVLAFVLGLAAGGGESAPASAAEARGVWVLRVATFKDTEEGMAYARAVGGQLADLDEVTYNRVLSKEQLVVGLGSWLRDPSRNRQALELRDKVRATRTAKGERPYADADFWTVPR